MLSARGLNRAPPPASLLAPLQLGPLDETYVSSFIPGNTHSINTFGVSSFGPRQSFLSFS